MSKQYLFFLFIVLLQGFTYAQSRGDSYYKIEENGLWGLMDSNHQVLIPCEYQRILFYSDSLIFYKDNDLWGFMNYEGKILVPATYSFEIPNESVFPLYWNVKAKTYQKDPNITPSGDYKPYFKKKVSKNVGGWGFGDSFDGRFNQVEDDESQEKFRNNGFVLVQSKRKMGALNLKGEVICPFIYDDIEVLAENPFCFRINKEGYFGLMNNKFQIVLAPEYNLLEVWESDSYEQTRIIVGNDKGEFHHLHYFKFHKEDWTFRSSDLELFPTNWLLDIYNLKGEKLSTQSYDMLSCLERKEGNVYQAKVQVGKTFGIINANGEVVIPADYECIVPLYNHVYKVCKKDKWGLLDLNGNEVIPIVYDFIGNFHPSFNAFNALAKKDGLYGVIDFNGKTLLPFQYRYLTRFDDTHFLYFEKDAYRLLSIGKDSPTFKDKVNWE